MDISIISAIISAIGSVGFPIVMCLLMFKSNADTLSNVKEMSVCIENNTRAIEKLEMKLEAMTNEKN